MSLTVNVPNKEGHVFDSQSVSYGKTIGPIFMAMHSVLRGAAPVSFCIRRSTSQHKIVRESARAGVVRDSHLTRPTVRVDIDHSTLSMHYLADH